MLGASPDMVADSGRYEALIKDLHGLYPDLRQLMDGFLADAEQWSEWDESVRQRLIALGVKWLTEPKATAIGAALPRAEGAKHGYGSGTKCEYCCHKPNDCKWGGTGPCVDYCGRPARAEGEAP